MSADIGQVGQIIDGKYRLTRLLGSGGMGAVYEGENVRIRRKVAIKMLHGAVSSQPDVVARFEREAQAAALVGSEHICEVLDMGMLPDETRYMVMEYLEGDTLSGLIKKSGRLGAAQSTPILLQILDALGAAHAAGIIHRDLKPDNVFILPQKGTVQNFVKILDFGVSKFSQLGGEAMNVTRAGAVVGTPYYMSPEQARGSSAIDQRTDIYAIGVLLYQATTGQVPYNAETFNELLFKIVLEQAPPPQTFVPDLDPEFAAIIQKAMCREPDQRFQSCQQFRDALAQYQASRANPLPAYALPQRHDPAPARTEALDFSKMPGGASWPGAPPGADPTLPMQPGLQIPSLATSGAPPLGASTPGAPPLGVSTPGAPPMEASTGSSWGNASSAAAGAPRSRAPMLIGVVALAALLGVGGAVVASKMLGKPRGSTAQAATTPPPAATPAPPAASATPTATASTASGAPTADASATPSASASSASAAPSTAAVPPTGKVGIPTGKVPGSGPAPAGKTVTPPAKKGKAKGPGNDLGY